MKSLVCYLIVPLCLCLISCESGSDRTPLKTETYLGSPIFEASNVEIKDGVKSFEPANGLLSVIVEPERLLYEFTADANAEINVGDVLVGAEENGFIRRAVDVSRNGNTVDVTTERATLLDALQSADISIRFGPGVLLEDAESTNAPNAGNAANDDNNVNGEDDGSANEIELDLDENQSPLKATGQQIEARQFNLLDEKAQFFKELNRELNYPLLGEVGDGLWLTGFVSTALDFDFTLKIRDGEIVSSESELRGEVQGALTLRAESTLELEASRDISLLSLRPIVLVGAVGFLPFVVTLTPELGLTFGGRIGTNASLFTARMSAGSTASAKVVYQTTEDRWKSIYEVSPPTFNADVDVQGSRIKNSVAASVALVPQVNVQFYESSGARLKVPLTVEATVETDTQDPCANVGLDLTASVLLTPESRWDWISDLFAIDDIELIETSLASATFKPCLGAAGNQDQTGPDGGTDSMDQRDQGVGLITVTVADMGTDDTGNRTDAGQSDVPGEPIAEELRCQASLNGVANLECAKWFGVSNSTDGTRFGFGLGRNLNSNNVVSSLIQLELESGSYLETRGQHVVSAMISNERGRRILDYEFQSGECRIRLNTTLGRTTLPHGQDGAMVDLDADCTLTDGDATHDLSIQAADYPVNFQ